jgi:putative hemolysin
VHTASPPRDCLPIPDASTLAARFSTLFQSGAPLGKIGSLEVRLARSDAEIEAAQEVRYRVFCDELGAKSGTTAGGRRDVDRFDEVCDHLLVLDTALPGPDPMRIVGTYRLLRQEAALAAGGFYSEEEFDLRGLVARHPGQNFLELGRSCVLPGYRSKRTIEVLWQGIWAYVNHHRIGAMVGCASFHGTDPVEHAQALSYLAHHCRAAGPWEVRAVPGRYKAMDLLPPEAINLRAALAAMPPLIKGYLRLGASIGEGCVIDPDFGTVDVFIVLPVEHIDARYIQYYSSDDKFAA